MITVDQRNAFTSLLVPFNGKGAGLQNSLEVRTEVARLLTPNDELALALSSLPGMSNCNMVQLGFERLCGVKHRTLDEPYFKRRLSGQPYVARVATVDVQTIARDLGAWRDPSRHDAVWLPGDMPIIGGSGYEPHGFVVMSHSPVDAIVESIDGGQGNHGAEIAWRTRRLGWDASDRRYWTWEGPGYSVRGRPLLGWVDLAALLDASGATS